MAIALLYEIYVNILNLSIGGNCLGFRVGFMFF